MQDHVARDAEDEGGIRHPGMAGAVSGDTARLPVANGLQDRSALEPAGRRVEAPTPGQGPIAEEQKRFFLCLFYKNLLV